MIYTTVTGRLTKDAELKTVGNGKVCAFSVASNDKSKGEERVSYIECSLWSKRGEALAPYLKKGSNVTVMGRFSTREYNGKTYLEIKQVDQVELMGGGSKTDKPSAQPTNNGYASDDPDPF